VERIPLFQCRGCHRRGQASGALKRGTAFSDGPERYTTRRIAFAHPFTLGRSPEVYPAGSYEIETKEEAHEAGGHTAYLRTSTVLIIPTQTGTRHHTVSGRELDDALIRDGERGNPSEPKENPDRGAPSSAS
jgi:hypothetical protein